MKHIKEPVRVFEYAPDMGMSDIQGADGITYIEDIPTEAAQELVKAINAYDIMLAACKRALLDIELHAPITLSTVGMLEKAIALAEGGDDVA